MTHERERAGGEIPASHEEWGFLPSFTAEEREAWREMRKLLDRQREFEGAPVEEGAEWRRRFSLGVEIEWPPRDIGWMDGKTPGDMAAQGRQLEAACRVLEGVEEAGRLRIFRRVAELAQSPVFLSACGKWAESCSDFLAHHP